MTPAMAALPGSVGHLLDEHRIIVCAGSGGVGKTTMSAALAIEAARRGKRAVVVTIDPAKRLATSLGRKTLASVPSDLTKAVDAELKKGGLPPCKGKFFAVMPDTTRTFERFVRTIANGNEKLVARILDTSIYKIFAKEFSGANEYMAMAKLGELHDSGRFDIIVLDTPPSANTRMFLEAPRLLSEFFDDRIIRWFVTPGARIFAGGVHKMLEIMETITGRGFMSQMLEFTSALFELRVQFRENLNTVASLLHDRGVAFTMVTSPERLSREDTQDFVALIQEKQYPFWGFIVNRTLSERVGLTSEETSRLLNGEIDLAQLENRWAEKLAAIMSDRDIAILRDNFQRVFPKLAHEIEGARFLRQLSGSRGAVLMIPEQSSDVHSVGALVELCRQISDS